MEKQKKANTLMSILKSSLEVYLKNQLPKVLLVSSFYNCEARLDNVV
jgi:hypothetical protein